MGVSYWFIGLLVYWFIGLLVYWSIGLLVYWFIGSLFIGLIVIIQITNYLSTIVIHLSNN